MYQDAIDFSRYQGDVDFNKLIRQNVAMCYIKATDGTNWTDPWFSKNVEKCKAFGQAYAPYHYYQPGQDPKLQAKNFLTVTEETQEPPLIDVEETRGISTGYATRLFSFLVEVEKAWGVRPTLYTRGSYWKLYLGAAWNWARGYRVLWANYREDFGPLVCLPWDPANWYAWQYGTPALGSIYGMQTKDVDSSIFNLDGLYKPSAPVIDLGVLQFLAAVPLPPVKVPISPLEIYREWQFSRQPNYRKG